MSAEKSPKGYNMKLSSIMLAGVISCTAFNVSADTFDRNFLSSFQGQVSDAIPSAKGTGMLSTDVSIAHREYTSDNGIARKKTFTEYMEYYLTDRLNINGDIARDWNRYSNNGTSKSKLDRWSIGVGYRFINDGKHTLNAMLAYGQKDDPNEGLLKGFSVYGAYGYNLGIFIPHTILALHQSINAGKRNDENWYWYGGATIPIAYNFSAELGLEYDRQASRYKNWGTNTSVNYTFNDFLTTELYSQYILDSSVTHDSGEFKIKKSYTIGLRITTAF